MTQHEPPSVRYEHAVAQGTLKSLEAQRRVLPHLDALQAYALQPYPRRRLWRRRRSPRLVAPKVYLWGPPGAGKTRLMDCLVNSLPPERIQRVHMHAWLDQLQHHLNQRAHPDDDALTRYVDQVARVTSVLCLDECFVDDITTACWLGRLLPRMTASGMAVVMTSNQPPGDLYRGGVQRQRFLPTIAHLQEAYHVLHLDPGEDCRRGAEGPASYRALHAPHVQVTPTGEPSSNLLERFHASVSLPQPSHLKVHGRTLATLGHTESSLHLNFHTLVNAPRCYRDMLALTACYERFMISGIRPLQASDHGKVLNWIHAIDVLIDTGREVWLVSTVPMAAVYPAGRYMDRFQRTLSRLTPRDSEPPP